MSMYRRRIMASWEEAKPSGYAFPVRDGYQKVMHLIYQSPDGTILLMLMWQTDQDVNARSWGGADPLGSSAGKLIAYRADFVGADTSYNSMHDYAGWYTSTDGGHTWEIVKESPACNFANIKGTSNSNKYTLIDSDYRRS